MRQRTRLTPVAPQSGPLTIGIQLRRSGGAVVVGAAPTGEVTPPTPGDASIVVTVSYCFGGQCNWYVMLCSAATEGIEWAATWDDMESSPTAVEFSTDFPPDGPLQGVYTNSGSITGIVFYATVDGVTYQSDPMECQV